MNIDVLKTELDTDPLSRGYSGMTDAQATASLNTANRSRNRSSLTGDELFTATDGTEFAALTDAKRANWVAWCNTDRDPFNAANVAFVQWVFGGGSDTVANLATIRLETVSRAVELGLGNITEGDVQTARAM